MCKMSPKSKRDSTTKNQNNDIYMDLSSDSSKDADCKSSATARSSTQFGRVNRIILDKNSSEYKKRRERNNLAVKKSRNKSKLKTQQTMQRVAELKAENERLETKVAILSKELNFLKDLFLAQAGSAHNGELDLNLTNRSHQIDNMTSIKLEK